MTRIESNVGVITITNPSDFEHMTFVVPFLTRSVRNFTAIVERLMDDRISIQDDL